MSKNKKNKNKNNYAEMNKESEDKSMMFEEEKEILSEVAEEEPTIEKTEELEKTNSDLGDSVDTEPYKQEVFEEKSIEENKTSKKTTCRLNVRSEKDKNSKILKVLEKDEVVVGKESGNWFELDGEGYVMSEFLK